MAGSVILLNATKTKQIGKANMKNEMTIKYMATAIFKDAKGVSYLLSCRLSDDKALLEKSCDRFYETSGSVLVKMTPLFSK